MEPKSKLSQPDRDRYLAEIASLKEKLSSRPDEQGVWEVYARTEKLIAVLKFRLDYETPGLFIKLPKAEDQDRLLAESLTFLAQASKELAEGRAERSVEVLRKARNNLRSYLRENKLRSDRRTRQEPGRPAGAPR